MYQEHRVTVVIPAHNEELLIERVVDGIPPYVDHVIVVDDASSDRTREKLEILKARHGERLIVVLHALNQGVGGAIVTGYETALKLSGEKHLIAVMAGDAQMDPEDLPKLLAPCARGEVHYATVPARRVHADHRRAEDGLADLAGVYLHEGEHDAAPFGADLYSCASAGTDHRAG